MEYATQKYNFKSDAYFKIVAILTAKAVLTLLCIATIIVAIVVIGTIMGELMWVIVPYRGNVGA